MAAKILLQCWKEMVIGGRHIRAVCRMFQGSVVTNWFFFNVELLTFFSVNKFVKVNFIFLLCCSPDESLNKNKF